MPSAAAFDRQVRGALAHLHDLPYLQTHPLGGLRGRELRARLVEAVELLKARPGADGSAGRVQRLLALRYVDALDSRAVAGQLGISQGEYYREHAQGIAAVAALLREALPSVTAQPDGPALAGNERSLDSDRLRLRDPALHDSRPRQHPGAAGGPSAHHNLPRPLTSLVGRQDALAALSEFVTRARLVTLTGPGGVGKTRLALAAAAARLADFPDGVWLVDLAPATGADRVVAAAALALAGR